MPGNFTPLGISHWKIMLGGKEAAGFFRKLSGISLRVDHQPYYYGDDPGSPHHSTLPSGELTFGDISLERGIDVDKQIWDWHQTAIMGEPEYLEGTIELLDFKNQPIAKFKFMDAWPKKYSSSGVGASQKGQLATETVEIAVNRLERIQ
jgi:phage tail-like protein